MTDVNEESPLEVCSEEDCDRPVQIHAHALCRRCYNRRARSGTLTPILCPVPECANNHYQRGPCRFHRAKFADAGMKWCTNPACGEPLKAEREFYSNGRKALSAWCKSCDLPHHQEISIRKREANPGRRHGLTADQYWSMFTAQDSRCAICQKGLARNSRKSTYPNIDHDHVHCPGSYGCRECVRSLICNGCNILLGRAQDNPAILRRWGPTKKTPQQWLDSAIAYLEYWHAIMAERGIRPPLDEALWQDLCAAMTSYVFAICPA